MSGDERKRSTGRYSPAGLGLVTGAILLIWSSAACGTSSPYVSGMPILSATTMVADDVTPYTVTMTASDAQGYLDVIDMRTLFNGTEGMAMSDPAVGRGYFAWGATDADITKYGGTWMLADAAGGGRWGYMTDSWGGTLYVTPESCAMATVGQATEGVGSRTVTWTFRVKPAWASNPLTNDADAWARDAVFHTGWLDNADEFDVVAQACSAYAATPRAPIVSNPGANSLDVALNPADPGTESYAIRVLPDFGGRRFVQADGSLGWFPVFQQPGAWGTTTVTGLAWGTTYAVSARAYHNAAGYCASAYGPDATGSTTIPTLDIDMSAEGTPINPFIRGQQPKSYQYQPTFPREKTLEISFDTSIRLGGDPYGWKDRTGQFAGSLTTLEFLRETRDRDSELIMIANVRGVGTGTNPFIYTDKSPATLAILDADWVRYTNFILQTYRQGDPISGRDADIVSSLEWGDYDHLLAPGEPPTPKVTYWEMGNEPEVGISEAFYSMSPSEYLTRYKTISSAMVAEDPTIKVGPCITNAPNDHLNAVLADSEAQVDFVSYHPYGALRWEAFTPEGMENGLRKLKRQQEERHQNLVDALTTYGRNPETPFIASEWNPSSWESMREPVGNSMAHGLGTVETLFTFAELGLFAAQYYEYPAYYTDGTELPVFKAFEGLQDHLGDTLVYTSSGGVDPRYSRYRLYITRDSATGKMVLWGLNFSETLEATFRLNLRNLSFSARKGELWVLGTLVVPRSLLTSNEPGNIINADWTSTAVDELHASDLTFTLEPATLSVLVIDPAAQLSGIGGQEWGPYQ